MHPVQDSMYVTRWCMWCKVQRVVQCVLGTPRPLAISCVSARQVTVSRGGGGGDCKGTGSLSEVFSKIGSSHSQNRSSTSGV